jgi:hypothetical protein
MFADEHIPHIVYVGGALVVAILGVMVSAWFRKRGKWPWKP